MDSLAGTFEVPAPALSSRRVCGRTLMSNLSCFSFSLFQRYPLVVVFFFWEKSALAVWTCQAKSRQPMIPCFQMFWNPDLMGAFSRAPDARLENPGGLKSHSRPSQAPTSKVLSIYAKSLQISRLRGAPFIQYILAGKERRRESRWDWKILTGRKTD